MGWNIKPFVLAAVLFLSGCSPLQNNLPDLMKSVAVVQPAANDEIAARPLITGSAPTAIKAVGGTGQADWPAACDAGTWPARQLSQGLSGEEVAGALLKVAGLKDVTDSGGRLLNVLTDSEMGGSDTTKQAYLWHALGSEKDKIHPMSAHRFGDFLMAQRKAAEMSAQAKAQHGPRSAEYASSLALLATVHTDAGVAKGNDKAEAYWRESIAIFREKNMLAPEAEALQALGHLVARHGRYSALKPIVDRLLSLHGLPQPVAMLTLPLAARLDAIEGNFTPAFRKLATALQYWDTRLTQTEANAGDLKRQLFGVFMVEGAFDVVPQLESARILSVAADMLYSMGRPAAAERLIEQAIAKTRNTSAQFRPERVDILIQGAEFSAAGGKADAAASMLKSVRNMHWWNMVLINRATANADYARGAAAMKAGDPAEAERYLRYALAWWQTDLGGSAEALRPSTGLAKLYVAQNRLQAAEHFARLSVCFADKLRGTAAFAHDSRSGRAVREAYIAYLQVVFARSRTNGSDKAVATAFRAAQGAASGLAARGIETSLQALSASDARLSGLIARRNQIAADAERSRRASSANLMARSGLLREIQQAALQNGPTDPKSKAVWSSRVGELAMPIVEMEAEPTATSEQLAGDLRRVNEQIAGLAGPSGLLNSRDVGIDEIRQSLSADDLLVQYVVADERTYVIAIDKQAASMAEIGAGAASLRNAVNRVRASLTSQTRQPFDGAVAADLHRALVQPIGDMLNGKKRVIFIKDGPLAELPFALLKVGGVQGPWLFEQHAIATMPSAHALWLTRKKVSQSRAPKPFIGIGNPLKAVQSANELGIAKLQAGLPSITALDEIPKSADELKAVAKAFGAGENALLLREAATEARVRAARLGDYRVISFATHALMPGERAENDLAAIVLSSASAALPESQDGLLTSREIATLKLDADLVILSACNTAAGNDSLGSEKLGGLTRSFFAAGARSVIASHWWVDDNATQELMATFAASYLKSGDKAQALRSAMLSVAKSGNTQRQHPYSWAAFDLIGL